MPSLIRDGIALAYDKVDGHDRAIVLIHGWCCDRTYLAPQAEYFTARGHAVMTLDLRGHGESDAPEGPYPVEVFADDVAALCDETGIMGAVVVGHSMGGIVGFDLAIRYPQRVAGLVMIDSAVARPAASRAALPAFIERLKGPERIAAVQDYAGRALFQPTDDTECRTRILDAMARTPRHVMVGAMEGMYEWDPSGAIGTPLPPAVFIANSGNPLSDLVRLAEIIPDLEVGRVVGSGHFCTLEVPDQINAMVARFVALIEPATAY